jgi:hypothetical protein
MTTWVSLVMRPARVELGRLCGDIIMPCTLLPTAVARACFAKEAWGNVAKKQAHSRKATRNYYKVGFYETMRTR